MGGKKGKGYWGTNPNNYYFKPVKLEIVALDCEFVGCGPDGSESYLARVTALDHDGDVLMDHFIQPKVPVTDYRTHVSGITPQLLEEKAELCFTQVKYRVMKLLKKRLLVGHGLQNDLEVLSIHHPWHLVRDTACYQPYMKLLPMTPSMAAAAAAARHQQANATNQKNPYGGVVGAAQYQTKHVVQDDKGQSFMWCPRSLKDLAKQFLHRDIQTGCHSSQEDALAALHLYRLDWKKWDEAVGLEAKQMQQQTRQHYADNAYRYWNKEYHARAAAEEEWQRRQYSTMYYHPREYYHPYPPGPTGSVVPHQHHQQQYQQQQWYPTQHPQPQTQEQVKWAMQYAVQQKYARMREQQEDQQQRQAKQQQQQQLQQQWPTPQQSLSPQRLKRDNATTTTRVVSPCAEKN